MHARTAKTQTFMSATETGMSFCVYQAEHASDQNQMLEWDACRHIPDEYTSSIRAALATTSF